MDRYDLYAGVRLSDVVPRRAQQLVHPPQPGPLLEPGRGEPASDQSKAAAYDTLYTVLHVLCRCRAPLLPMRERGRVPGPDGATQRPPHGLAGR